MPADSKSRYTRYIVEYTLDDGLSGKFCRYTLKDAREFIAKNELKHWTLWGENQNGFQFTLDNWRMHLGKDSK